MADNMAQTTTDGSGDAGAAQNINGRTNEVEATTTAAAARAERAERRGTQRDVRWKQRRRRWQHEQQLQSPRQDTGLQCEVCSERADRACRCDR